jgi:hypothetical protein
MAVMENDITRIKEDIDFTRQTCTRMELEHGDQLRGLFDNRSLAQNTLDRHTEQLNRIENRLENIEIRIGGHDRQLKALN